MTRKIFLWALFASPMTQAQTPTDSLPIPTKLKEVYISSLHLNDSLMRAPASVFILSKSDLQRNNHTDVSHALNLVPGVLMQSSNFTTSRLSIRGIGARTPYGTNKIRAFYGNIPLTSGDGETTIDDIDLENIDQIEIIKGPLSTLYGAGLGGAVLIAPKVAEKPGNTASLSTVYGSFGLIKNSINYNWHTKAASLNLGYHKLETDGWRDNSAYDREGITLAGELFKKNKSKLTYFGNYTWLKAFIPSSIDKKTFDGNPKAAAPTWMASKGYKQYESVLGGLSYDWEIVENWHNSTSVFVNYKDNYEPRPFDILGQYTFGYGARTQFSGDFNIGKIATRLHVGVEYFRDKYAGRTAENLYQTNNGNGSLEGNRLTAEQQNRTLVNTFAQWRLALHKKWELQTGLSVNHTTFDLDSTIASETASEEKYRYNPIWSPQASLLFKPNAAKTVYFSASRGFSLPSVQETLTAFGTVNTQIKPERGLNLELGGKFYFFGRRLYAEITGYRMQISDLLVARRVGDDQYVGVNAGQTLHQGVEFLAQYLWDIGKATLRPYVSVSAGDYRFEEFDDNGNDHADKRLTGVPKNKANMGLSVDVAGWYFSGDFIYVDAIPLNDGNTAFSDAYRLLHLKTGYRFEIMERLRAQVAAGVNNVLDDHYAALVLPNATAFGNAQPRYYYPGLPINYYANIGLSYAF